MCSYGETRLPPFFFFLPDRGKNMLLTRVFFICTFHHKTVDKNLPQNKAEMRRKKTTPCRSCIDVSDGRFEMLFHDFFSFPISWPIVFKQQQQQQQLKLAISSGQVAHP